MRRLFSPRGDPGIGRRLGHALADEAVARGGTARFVEALRSRPAGHAVSLRQRSTGRLSRPPLRSHRRDPARISGQPPPGSPAGERGPEQS